jgi:small nuclear ribonucleoprotein (snRNP)-like protein
MTRSTVDGVQHGGPGSGPEVGDSDGSVDAALVQLTDDQRAADAVEARRREQALRQQSAESGCFGGVLTDLAERGDPVSIATVSGRVLRGTVTSMGPDHLLLQTPAAERSLVVTSAITSVRTAPGGRSTVGDREVRGERPLTAVLADLATERPPVVVHLVSGEAVAGTLWSSGRDLLSVRTVDRTMTYVATAAISDLLVS